VDAVKPAPAKYRQDRGPLVCVALRVGTDCVTPTTSVRDLGIYVDSDVSMRTHVSRSGCFAVLRQLRSILRSTSPAVLLSLVVSLVLSRLDYGNTKLAALPGYQLDRLQSVINAAARRFCSARKYEHITPLLRDLHWLRVSERIEFKLSVLVFRCLHGTAPPYLASEPRRVDCVCDLSISGDPFSKSVTTNRDFKVTIFCVHRRPQFLPRDAMHKRGICRHTVSVHLYVCPSVCHVREFCQNE